MADIRKKRRDFALYAYSVARRGRGNGGGGGTPIAPSNLTAPAISGAPTIGEALTASTGTWANKPISYAYQWYADDVAIVGATNNVYILQAAEDGDLITVGVVASNAAGSSDEELSAAVGPVAFPLPSDIADLAAVAQSTTAILLEFTPATYATSHEYRIDGGSAVVCDDNTGSQLVDGLALGTEYDFEVRGVNAVGNGDWSNIATEPTDSATIFNTNGDSTLLGNEVEGFEAFATELDAQLNAEDGGGPYDYATETLNAILVDLDDRITALENPAVANPAMFVVQPGDLLIANGTMFVGAADLFLEAA